MKMYLVRHGESEYNAAERLTGHTDVPLTEKGKEQARNAIPELPPDISKIYSSDLVRCKQTTDILNSERQLPITYDARLRERNYGSLSGKRWQDIDPDGALKKKDKHLQYDYRPHGGESAEDVKKRVGEFVDDIRERERGNAILVVTSAGVIRLLHHVHNNTVHETIHNSSIHAFEFTD